MKLQQDNATSLAHAKEECTVERTLRIVGPKWTTLILRDLLSGHKRFGELNNSLHGISPKTLTDRLRELEEHGVITRTIYPEIPPRVEYALTEKGRALAPVIDAMAAWGAAWTAPARSPDPY
jgi:DNA-binding HxlR family transcriptional regulator